ncbi:DNA-protecting protein DprA [Candidatus Wolfebacteria bacterium]|nr:DNA-protecting protein DprA [Candidatus Wolfebacteria bacterium]
MKSITSKINFVDIHNPEYPNLLREIPNPPKKIYFLGELPADKENDLPRVAIVGTRKATVAGKLMAKKISQKLSEMGIIVVSGLAMGIDTAAHEGAILAGAKTIAVLANGLDSIYPRQNENLAKRILELGGAIISEYPVDAPALPHQFLERNRIVSGLCAATIVIEAPIESGALVTARLAAEQGREVFVFPGSADHPNFRGSHKLIRDGARLVSSFEDIMEDLSLEISNSQFLISNKISNSQNIKDEKQLLIFNTIREAGGTLNIDKIIELTKLEPQIANQSVAIMVIEGTIKETERGYIL